MKYNDFYWANDASLQFMYPDYLDQNETPQTRVIDIANNAEIILGINGFADKFYNYMAKGYYSLSTPVWKNFSKENGSPISCVVGDTWINTINGGKLAKDIEIGDLVLTHKNRFKKVVNVIPTKNKDDIYRLKVGTRMTNLYITGNHVVLTNLGWIRVDELDVNKHLIAVNGELDYESSDFTIDLKKYTDYNFIVEDGFIKKSIETKSKKSIKNNISETHVTYYSQPREFVDIDNDLAWAFGLWFAEGSISINNKKEPNGIRITLNDKDESKYANKWLSIMKDKFNLNGGYYISEVKGNGKNNSWISVNINSKVIGNLFASFGKGCKEKQLPDWLLNLPKDKLKHLLNGLLLGDGTKSNQGVRITLSNPKLLLQAYNIGLKLNHDMSLQMQEKAGKLSTTTHVYTLTFREYNNSISKSSSNAGIKFSDGLTYCPIKVLEKTDKIEDVFDFTVEDDHSFSCAGVVVHNCFGIDIQDDTSDILRGVAEIGMMTKQGGGTAGYFGKLRPRGASISGGSKSNGSVSFMPLFQEVTNTISQTNRRGFFAAYHDIDHDDFDEFMKARTEGDTLQTIALALCVSDDFMKRVENGDKEAQRRWVKVIKKRDESGFPYLYFTDTANKNKPQVYKDKNMMLRHSQMCVSYDTLILTDNGYKCIGELEDSFVNVWNGQDFSEVEINQTGENQTLFRVNTDSGYSLDCTEYHKWYVLESTESGKRTKPPRYKEVRTYELKQGDKLIKFDLPILQGFKELKYAYTQGFFSGDGYSNPDVKKSKISLYGEKKDLLLLIDVRNYYTQQGSISRPTNEKAIYIDKVVDRINCYLPEDIINDKTFVPNSDYTIESRLNWLSGLVDSDGTIAKFDKSYTLQIGSIDKEFLKAVQLMLQTLGCDSKVTKSNNTKGLRLLPKNDGSGELGYYNCQQCYRLLINGNSLWKLIELGFKLNRVDIKDAQKPNRECSQFIKVESVEQLPDLHDTYCFTEPKRNMGMFNGILTGNCNEIYEYTDENVSFVCALSSVNLLHWDEIKNTDAIETLTYFMDAVYTEFINKAENVPFMDKAVRFAKDHRSIGIGVLGWHSYLQRNNLPFACMESNFKTTEIFKTIDERTLKASKELAVKYGEPTILKGYGERFTTRTALAPTTSSSFILGQVSPSIEPLLSNCFVKDLSKGKFFWKNPFLEQLLEKKGLNNDDIWDKIMKNDGSVQYLDELSEQEKEVFKTFAEISQKEIIIQASIRQKFIDQGQSLNLMLHPETTMKENNSLLFEAWRLGLKGLYYQRSANVAQKVSRDITNCTNCES